MNTTEEKKRADSLRLNELNITTHLDEKPYVFLSYKSDDWSIVLEEIAYKMQMEYGLRIYYDRAFESNNDDWTESIKANIKNKYCVAVIAFVSTKYVSSYATLLEILTSQTEDASVTDFRSSVKPIIPVFLEDLDYRKKMIKKVCLNDTNKNTGIKKEEWDVYKECIEDILEKDNKVSPESIKKVCAKLNNIKDGDAFKIKRVALSFEELENILTKNYNKMWLSNFYTSLKSTIESEYNKYFEEAKEVGDVEVSNIFDEELINPSKMNIPTTVELEKNIVNQEAEGEEEIKVKQEESPVLIPSENVDIVQNQNISTTNSNNSHSNLWRYTNRKGANATIIWENEYTKKCIIKKGSKVGEEAVSFATSVPAASSLKQELIAKGIIVDGIFQMDYPSDKISTMINLIGGGSINMRGEIQKGAFVQIPKDMSRFPLNEVGKMVSQEVAPVPMVETGKIVHFQDAEAVLTGKGCIVKAGSLLTVELADSCSENVKRMRNEALQNGELEAQNGKYVLKVDKEFASLSAAAGFVCGYSVNGKISWK